MHPSYFLTSVDSPAVPHSLWFGKGQKQAASGENAASWNQEVLSSKAGLASRCLLPWSMLEHLCMCVHKWAMEESHNYLK